MPKQTQRKTFTIYGERGWGEDELDPYSAHRGYQTLNDYINGLSDMIEIHSVSLSSSLVPELVTGYHGEPEKGRLWIFATVVYSGPIDLINYFGTDRWDGRPLQGNETVFRVAL